MQIRKFLFQRAAFGRELEIVFDDFSQQAREEAQRQPLQGGDVAGDQFPCFWRIAIELPRFEIGWKHRIYKSSGIGLPCAREAENPNIEPRVGTRSVDSNGRSKTTPSRTPAPNAIIQVVRERASPVRWCWKPLPPESSSESRPKSGSMKSVVLPAYSGSLWMVFHISAQSRSVRRMPSMYSENAPACAMSMSCLVIHSRLGASWRIRRRAMYTESSSGLDNVSACALKSSTESFSIISNCCN